MKKKIICMLFLTVSLLITGNAYAGIGDLLLSGAEAVEILVKANHWQAFLCGSILTGCWIALGKLKQTNHKSFARARAFFLYVTGVICIILIVAEYWAVFVYLFGLLLLLAEYARETTSELIEYITD